MPRSYPYGISVSEAVFEEHVDAIARFARPASLSEVVEELPRGGPPQWTVVLTFDDAYAFTLERVEPLLRKHRISGCVRDDFHLATPSHVRITMRTA